MLIVHLFVSYAHVNLCHFFSSFWYQGLTATSACGSSWTFLFSFLCFPIGYGRLFNLRRLQAKSKVQTEVVDKLLYVDDMAKNASTERKMIEFHKNVTTMMSKSAEK